MYGTKNALRLIVSSGLNDRKKSARSVMQSGRFAVVISAMTLMLFVLPAQGANNDPSTLAGRMSACADLTDSSRRLACYDRLNTDVQRDKATVARTPVAAKSVVIPVTPAAVTPPVEPEVEKSIGKRKKSGGLFGRKADRPADVSMTLVRAEKDGRRRWVFYFDNDQVWRQLESTYIDIPDGDAVPAILSHGVLGSINLTLSDNRKKIKVKRLK